MSTTTPSQQFDTSMRPKVGIAVMVFKDGKLLLGKRKAVHAYGQYGTPGGHLEYGESFEDAAARELLEETGLKATEFVLMETINAIYEGPSRHYVTIFMAALNVEGEPVNMEPEKCHGWEWVPMMEPFDGDLMLSIQILAAKKGLFPRITDEQKNSTGGDSDQAVPASSTETKSDGTGIRDGDSQS